MTKNRSKTKSSSHWRDENDSSSSTNGVASEPINSDDKTSKMTTISPVSFHKSSQRLEVMNSAEKREISQQVQKVKHEYDTRLKVYRQITTYRKWPLQDLAFQDLQKLMAAHLQGRLELKNTPIQHVSLDGPTDTPRGEQEWEDASATSDVSALSIEEPKRLRPCVYTSSNNTETPCSSSPCKLEKENVKNEFLAEVAILPTETTFQDNTSLFSSPLWCMEPRIFAVEKSTTGKRYYVVAQLGRFMDHYFRYCDPTSRHYYEVIPENTPCRLYFDLEYIKDYNKTLTDEKGEMLLEEFIAELSVEVQQRLSLPITRTNIVDLDSSTDKKFSRHLIVHLPQGKLFKNSVSCGHFVKRFIGRLAEELATGELSCRYPTLSQYLFVWKEEYELSSEVPTIATEQNESEIRPAFTDKRTSCFVDLGVYTKNRLFRIWGSCKYGKSSKAILRLASRNQFPVPKIFRQGEENWKEAAESLDRKQMAVRRMQDTLNWEDHGQLLADTLVVPPNFSKLLFELVPDVDEQNLPYPVRKGTEATRAFSIPQSSSYGPSPFPFLDNFVLGSLASRGGVVGSIRAWSVCPDRFNNISKGVVTYHMKDNRWCEFIGRPHKGNNIMWNVSLKDMTYWQTCHDPDCRRANFRGQITPLPPEVQEDLKEAMLVQALESDAEFEKALMTLSIGTDSVEYKGNHSKEKGNDEPCDTKESSFEEALVEFLNSNPGLCP